MITVLAMLIVLGIVVFVHELGHFFAARWAGARVDVFSIGFGRPIIKWHDSHDTEWRIAWLPLGGFVRIYGQDDMFDRKAFQTLSAKKKVGHYLSLSAWKQAVIIGAGAFMNLLLAFIIYTGLFIGEQTIQLPVVGYAEPAGVQLKFDDKVYLAKAPNGLKVGDRIMQVNGISVDSWQRMIIAKEMNAGKDNNLVILRGDKLIQVKMPSGKWGVAPDVNKTEVVRYGFFGAIVRGADELWTQSRMMISVLGQMISGDRSHKQLGGIIHIADMSGRALLAGLTALFSMIALISVNLGVINLLPLPVLDGGYLLMILIEAVTRRKLQGRAMDWILRIGWGFLIVLILFTVWNDIVRLVAG